MLLIRHGESTWNLTGRYQGRIDTELSDRGQEQARRLAGHLKALPIEAVYSSPLRRAFHTALAVALEHGLDVMVEANLTEIDHGAWNGLLREEVEKRFGPLLQQWLEVPSQVTMPGGEGLRDVSQRAWSVVKKVAGLHPRRLVAICSHDAVIKTLITVALGMDMDRFWSLRLDNASVSLIEIGEGFGLSSAEGPGRLIYFNDTCHLGECRSDVAEQAL